MISKLTAEAIWVLLLSLSHVIKLLPLRVIQRLGKPLGSIIRILGFRTKIVRNNLNLAYQKELNPSEIQSIFLEHYEHLGKLFLETLRNLSLNEKNYRRESNWHDLDLIDKALEKNKGLAVMTGHFANWEFCLTNFAIHLPVPLSVIVKKMHSPIAQILVEKQRKKFGVNIIYFEERQGAAVREVFKRFKNNEVVVFVMDQHSPGSLGVEVNFYGAKARTTRALSGILQKTGVPLIMTSSIRHGDGTHEIFVSQEIEFIEGTSSKKKEEEIIINTQKQNDELEKWFRKKPSQWLWIHRRWKATFDSLDLNP